MIEYITNNWQELAGVVAVVILLAERIARITPTETDNRILKVIKRLADVAGVNVPDNPGRPES